MKSDDGPHKEADQKRAWAKFESLVKQILERRGFRVEKHEVRGDQGFDLVAQKDGERWAVEVKYYRTARAQPSLIQSAMLKVISASRPEGFSRGMLVVSSLVPEGLRSALEDRHGVSIVDRQLLRSWSEKEVDLLDQLDSLVEPESPETVRDERSYFNLELRPISDTGAARAAGSRGADLCAQLKAIPKGRPGWVQYETICVEILRYLFPKDLHGWHKQMRTDDDLNRYDFVCRVHPTTDFWEFVIGDLKSRYALFEFKNYEEKIGQGEVLTTEKYLLEKGLRRMAVMLTRKGATDNAHKMIQGAMREHGKFILVLDDELMCKMLHQRDMGDDPSDLLFELADDFLLRLPR